MTAHSHAQPNPDPEATTATTSPGLSRRTVLGGLAVATVATACLGGGEHEGAEDPGGFAGLGGDASPDALALADDQPLTTGPPTSSEDGADKSSSTTVKGAMTTTTGVAATVATAPRPTTAPGAGTSTTLPSSTVASSAPSSSAGPSTTLAPKTTTTRPTTTTEPPPPVAEPGVVLARLSFGASRDTDAELATMTEAQWLQRQLTLTGPDPAVEATIAANFSFAGTSIPEAFALHEATEKKVLRRELVLSNLLRATFSTHQVHEMLVHLWMDHFNVNIGGAYKLSHLAWDYQENVIRAHAMGTFHDLLVATANSPAMMVYLDNYRSNANKTNGVNENYGRELLELHTLGIEQDGTHVYTEADVVAASLVMSGWGIVYDYNNSPATHSTFEYHDYAHHSGTVTLLGGQFSTAGTSGKASGDALLSFLSHHPQTARYIAFKLIRRFVTDTPSEALIASTAQAYLANDTAIVPTLRHVLDSAEFARSAGSKLRRPFEQVVAALRATGSTLNTHPMSQTTQKMIYLLEDLGHEPWQWEQPDGFPDHADPWLSSDGLLDRWAVTAAATRGNLDHGDEDGTMAPDLARLTGSAATVGQLLDHLAVVAGLIALTGAEKTGLAAAAGFTLDTVMTELDADDVAELASFVLAHPRFQVR